MSIMNDCELPSVSGSIGFLLLLLLSFSCSPSSEHSKPLNVVFILVDDLGWNDLGIYGSDLHETPNLDAFARSSVMFSQAYASCPVCSPTRASIMTGKYPTSVGITDWIPGTKATDRKLICPEDLHALPAEEVTVAEALRAAGYQTFFAGKWHLGSEGSWPEDHGFDINIGGHHKGSPPGGYYAPYENPAMDSGPEGEYLPDRLTNEAIDFLETREDRPFLLYLSYYTVHTPIQASRRHVAQSQARLDELNISSEPVLVAEHEGKTVNAQYNVDYASMVTAMDENVGRLLESIEEQGLMENTLIIFTSDNGGLSTLPASRKAAPTSVRPLRAGKGWCYEGGIRVPLIIRHPGLPSHTSQQMVSSIDFYPTIISALDLELADGHQVDGIDILPFLENKKVEERSLFWHYPHYHGSSWTPGAAIRRGKWKLIEFYDYEKVELYDLSIDPGEQHDLSLSRVEIKNELLAELRQLQKKTKAQIPTANN